MKPDSQFHRDRLVRQMPCGVELGQALVNVAQVMVVPVGLRVERDQFLVFGERVALGGYFTPEPNPPV
jgi:hypothetical protein